jgi:uncharacterized protein (DUF486 family)
MASLEKFRGIVWRARVGCQHVTNPGRQAQRRSRNRRRYDPRRHARAEGALMRVFLTTAGLLICSNVFMTFAWYAHLRDLRNRAWYLAAVVSWSIALFEYLLQVPANRIGYTALTLAQLKILQEAITLTVFVPFAVFYMKQPIRLDFLWAGLCIMGAVYFIFRA